VRVALYGGRFEGKQSPLFRAFNDSLRFDARLIEQDVAGSVAWASALGRAGVLTSPQVAQLHEALVQIAAQAQADPARVLASGQEDVHSYVEHELIKRVGELGKRLHTGRSRNDQVATDLRLWTRHRVGELQRAVCHVRASLVALAERQGQVPLPGYTHLQRGQPVLLGHWALAYFEMLGRDAQRLSDALARVNVSPLGSGALAGTAYRIDRHALALDMGFAAPSANSLDAVSDRDFVFEVLSACALCSVHLSRLGEDLIVYTTSEFAFITMDDAVTSGSSLMPQKKNPDACELLRGKCGRILGALVALATTLKGLPLAYNKDLQEDKEPLFDATDHLLMCLRMTCPIVDTLKVNQANTRAAADDGFSAATDLADYLVRKGVPFRDAHHTAGQLTRAALNVGVPLNKLTIAQMQEAAGPHASRIEHDIHGSLTLEATLERRDVFGGTAPGRVAAAIVAARARVDADFAALDTPAAGHGPGAMSGLQAQAPAVPHV
jgi:argininosuccinate lyase